MKLLILISSTLILALSPSQVLAKPYAKKPYENIKKRNQHYLSFGLDYQDIKVDRFESSDSSPSFSLGYGYRINRYFEMGATASVKTGGGVTSEFVDTYAIPDHSSGSPVLGEPLTTTYRSTLNHSALLTLYSRAVLPLSRNFDFYVMAGGTYGQIKHKGFAHADGSINDNKNHAKTTEEYLDGIASNYDECYLTGVEAVCPSGAIVEYNESFSSTSFSYGAGLRWSWKDSGALHVFNIGASSLFRKDDFSILSYGISYEYKF